MILLASAMLCMSVPVAAAGVVLIQEGRGYCEAQSLTGIMLLLGGVAATVLSILSLASP